MKPFAVVVALVLAVSVLVVGSAAAAPRHDASDFAADCNADGIVSVAGTQKYVGGSGHLTRACIVGLTPGATLIFRGVTLTGTSSLAAISSPQDTTVRIVDSSVSVAGALELTAGCCAGEPWEEHGTVVVRRSALTGASVQLLASFDAERGRVRVVRSTLTATGPLGIQVRASDLGGARGLVKVRDSTLTSAGDLLVRTGVDGRTVVRRTSSSTAGTATVTTGVDGTCASTRNSPAIPCS